MLDSYNYTIAFFILKNTNIEGFNKNSNSLNIMRKLYLLIKI